jgi:predicted DNA-binding protein (MmcQ/YjbR family)
MTKLDAKLARAEDAIATFAAGFPQTTEDRPWGHRAFKVKGKAFLFLATDGGVLSLSVKLPASAVAALTLPFVAPTGYGLGKSGWVSATFEPGDDVPLGLVREWLEESFAAIAPKKIAAARAAAAGSTTPGATPPPAKSRDARSAAMTPRGRTVAKRPRTPAARGGTRAAKSGAVGRSKAQ